MTSAGGTPTAVFGSPSFTSAPVLDPGVYTDSVLVGETLLYGIDLDWGQQLVCDVEFGRSRSVNQALGYRNPTAIAQTYGPMRDGFFDSSQIEKDRALFNASRPVLVHSVTPPVRYLNRDGEFGITPASMPGTYYCGAFLNGDSDYASAGEVPLTVSMSVVGTAGEGEPAYAEDTTSPSASPAPAGERDGTTNAVDASESGGVPLWGWLLGLLVVLGLVLAVLSRRTPRRVS